MQPGKLGKAVGHPGPAGGGEMCCGEKGEGPVAHVAWRRRSMPPSASPGWRW